MKVYISLPISGRPIMEARQHASRAALRIREQGYRAVTPFDICPEDDKPYAWYMGKDIEELLGCDAVCMCRGWWRSKGCRLEFAAALIYGKRIMFEKCISLHRHC